MITNKYFEVLLRFLYYILTGSVIYFTINFIYQIYYNYPSEYVPAIHIGTILVCFIITEGLLIINKAIEKRQNWFRSKITRISTQSILDLLYTTILASTAGILLMKNFGTGGSNVPVTHFDMIVINCVTIVYAFIVVITKTLFDTYRNLKDSMIVIERFKKENTEAKLQSLKKQLSPHFLFNTLNTLYSIIEKDPEFAKYYLMKISEIYRYILMNEKNEIVQLEKEINFAKDYAFLVEKRYGGGLVFELNIPDALRNKYVPFLTLQILVENALKHNRLDQDNELTICVCADSEDALIIKNNIIAKNELTNGSGMGLQNLQNRYKYLINKKIDIKKTSDYFTVEVPLINVEQYESLDH